LYEVVMAEVLLFLVLQCPGPVMADVRVVLILGRDFQFWPVEGVGTPLDFQL
jgi:hypothetical protein